MLTRKIAVGIGFLAILSLQPYTSFCLTKTPLQTVRELVTGLESKIAGHGDSPPAPHEELKSAIAQYLDIGMIARSAIGAYWEALGSRQEEYVALVSAYITHWAAKKVRKINEYEFVYAAESIAGSWGRAEIIIKKRGPTFDSFEVTFRMHRDGEEWKIYGVAVNGIRIISNINSQFMAVIRRHMPKDQKEIDETVISKFLDDLRKKSEGDD